MTTDKISARFRMVRILLLLSFLGVFLTTVSSAFATHGSTGFRATGDYPNDAVSYTLEVYNNSQGTACDGSPDGSTDWLLVRNASQQGDSSFDDNNDYNATNTTNALPTNPDTLYFYFCQGTTRRANTSLLVNDGDDIELDFGIISAGGAFHDDLASLNAYVCNNTVNGGSQLNADAASTGVGGYTLYYTMVNGRAGITDNGGNQRDVFVLIRNNTANVCQFDSNVKASKRINTDISGNGENYGVQTTFEPDTKASGDLHTDLNGVILELLANGAGNVSVGIVNQSGVIPSQTPDGLNDSADDYDIYYDNPSSGTLNFLINVTNTNTALWKNITRVTGVANGFTDQDFVTKVNGTIPPQLFNIKTNFTATVIANATITGTGAAWTMYIPDNVTLSTGNASYRFNFSTTNDGPNNLTVVRSGIANQTITAGVFDTSVNASRYFGELHRDLKNGTDDVIAVYSDANCTTAQVSTGTLNPVDNSSGSDYEIFFEVQQGNDTYFVNATSLNNTIAWYSCGNAIAGVAAGSSTNVSLNMKVTGYVPLTITHVAIEKNTTDTGSGVPHTLNSTSVLPADGLYKVYLPNDTDNTAYALFYQAGTLRLNRSISLGGPEGSSNVTINVTRISGELHRDLMNNSDDLVTVHNSSICAAGGTLLSSQTVNPADVADDVDYNQYFEQRAATTTYYANFTVVSDSSTRVYSSCQNVTVLASAAATNVNVSALVRVNGTAPTDIDSVLIDIDGDNTPEVNATEDTTGSFSVYFVNDTDGSTVIRFGRGGNITLDITGRNFGNGSSTDVNNTINVSKISGALDAAFASKTSAGAGVRVIANWNVTPAVNYSNRFNVTPAPSNTAGVEDYWVYFQHQIVDGVATTIYDLEFNESTSSVNRTFFWNDTRTINAGDSYTLDLLNRINGTVPSDLVQIRVSTNNTVPNISAVGLVASDGTYSIYGPNIVAIPTALEDNATVTLRAQRPAEVTVLVNNTQTNITADREFNISKLRGDIPIALAGDTFEVDFNVSNACGDGNNAYASNVTSSSPYTLNASEDFALYFEAASRTYFWMVCDGSLLRLNRTVSATATSGTETRNVSQISGELHPSLDNGGASNNTNIRVFNTTDCSNTLISSEAIRLVATADAVDYNQTYESTNPNAILYLNVTGNSSLANSGGGVTGALFYSCVNATSVLSSATVAGGENSNVSILTMVEGNVTYPVKSVSVNITGTGVQNLNDSYVTLFNSSFYYYLFTPAGDAGSDMAIWNISSRAGQLLLSKERDLSSAAGAANVSFNVSSISGSLHADLDDQANDDIQVFGGANCADRLSTQDIASSGANYLQYFETTATGVIYLNVTNYDGTNNYTTCINTTSTKPQAGFNATAYNVNRRVQGNVTTAVGYAVIVPDQQADQVLEVNSTVVGTTPRSYKVYFSSDAASDIVFYNTTNTLVLNRTARTFDADAVVNVSRLIGDAHTDLTGSGSLIEVYNNTACAGRGATALLSSASVTPVSNTGADNDFTIYFEGNDGPTYYINATAVLGDGRQYITCGNSFIPIVHDNATSPSRRVFGILPNASLWNMTRNAVNINVSSTNITSIGINFKSGTGDDVNTSTNLTDSSVNRYYLYVNSSASSGIELSFYNYTAGGKTTMLNLTGVDLSADTGRNVSKVMGKTDTSLEDGTDTITVCSDAGCGTTLSTRTTNPAEFTGIMDYEIYYNHSVSTTQNYTLNISDVNGSFVLRSYLRFIPVSITDNGADTRMINLTRVFGTTREEANSNTIGNTNVTAFINGNGTIINSSTISNTSGNFFLYLDVGTHEINSTATGFVTGTTDVTVGPPTGFDPLVLYVLKITVRDPTGNPINATVNVTNNTGSTWTSYDTYNASNASAGGGVYYFNISPTTYNRVNITVKKSGFNTILDPDPQFTGAPISLTSVSQTARVYNLTRVENLVAPTLTGPPNGFYNNSNITFTWNAVDGASQYEFQLDDTSDFSSTTNATNTTATSIRTGLTLTDGLYYWRVRAISGITTGGEWSVVRTATFDTTNPSATINAPSARTNSSADTISISADATDAVAGVANVTFYSGGCGTTQIGIVSSAPWQLVWNVTVTDDGSKTLCARATDKAGNTGDSGTVTMIVDHTRPNATITSPTAGARLNGTVNLQTRVNDSLANISRVDFLVDGSIIQTNTSRTNFPSNADTTFSWDTTTVGDGGHLVAIVAYDTANNTNQTIAVNVTVDNGAPENLLITSPVNNSYVNDTVVIVASASDAIVINRVEFYNYSTLITNDTSAPWQAAWVTGVDGLNQLYATAYDSNNNRLNSSIISVTVDNTAPTLTIQDPVSGTTIYRKAGGVVDVDYTYTEVNVDKVEINVSNSTTTVGSKTITSGLTSGTSVTRNDSVTLNVGAPDGTYNVSVKVIDKTGKSVTTTVAQIVVVDTTQPTVSISSPTTGTINGTVTFALSVSDTGGAGVWKTELYANGANVSINSTTSPFDRLTLITTTLTDGSYTIFARAYDNSGNTRDSIPANLTIDNAGPYSVVITSPAANGTFVTGTVGLEATVGDAINVTRVEFYNHSVLITNDTNGAPWVASWDTTGLSGNHTLFAVAYDNVNNRINSSARYVTVDNTDPTVTVQYPTSTVYRKAGETLGVNYIYTETNPSTIQVNVSNGTHYAGTVTFNTGLTSGTNIVRNDSVPLSSTVLEGTYNVTALVTDKVGKVGTSSVTQIVVVDNSAPSASITSPAPGANVSGSISIATSISDVGSAGIERVELFVDGGLHLTNRTSPYGFTLNTTQFLDGIHTLSLRAFDNANNSVQTAPINVTVINKVPTVNITFPQNSSTTGTSLTLQAVTDVDATCNYATNTGTTFGQMANTGRRVHYQSLSGLSAGTNNATIHCRNWADSYGSNVSVTWTVDTSGPQVATVFALSPTNSDKVNGTLDINATVSYSGPNGNIGGAEYYIAVYPTIPSSTPNGTLNATDGTFSTTQEDVTGRIRLAGRSDDTYWICVIANTSNSLRGPRSCSTPFTLDTVLPVIRLYTPVNGTNVTDTTPTITFSVEDARTGVNLSSINVTNGTNGATLSGFTSVACSAVDYGATGVVQKYNCTFDSGALTDGAGINITFVARDNAWGSHNNNTNITVNSTTAVTATLNTSDTSAIADNTYANGWSFTFNVTLGSATSNLTSVNATAVRIANWTRVGGTETIATAGNTVMNYTDSGGTARTYYVSHDYNTTDTIYPLRDGDAQSVPINGTVTIYVKIPTSTLAGAYSTTFTFGSWVVPLTGGSPT